jgi:hypothetical protein
LFTAQALLQIAAYQLYEPSSSADYERWRDVLPPDMVVSPPSATNLDLFINELRLLFGLVTLVIVICAYYFQRTWRAPKPGDVGRRLLAAAAVLVVALLIGLYLKDNVDPGPRAVNLIERLNDVAMGALVVVGVPLPFIAYRRNTGALKRIWQHLRSRPAAASQHGP